MDENRIPADSSRGQTPEDAYRTAYNADEGDTITVGVMAESSGDIPSCDDRCEKWSATVEGVQYDSRKNIHSIVVNAAREGGDESGTGYVRHHTNKHAAKSDGLAFGSDANGSRIWFEAPVDVFEDDRDRTVVEFNAN